jgi:trans-aconitate methyltransferase
MTTKPGAAPVEEAHFDSHAANYDQELEAALVLSGENKTYFAEGRIDQLRGHLEQLAMRPKVVMDFGSGTGTSVPLLLDRLGANSLVGVDVSERSLDIARRMYGAPHVQFALPGNHEQPSSVDLVFTNGTFHHIPPAERPGAAAYVYRHLRPGGVVALWENNPWNPATRYMMSQCAFDDDAVTLTPIESRRLLRTAGFDILRLDFAFFFPAFLSGLRGVEPYLRWCPLGAQYQVLARKPVGS